MKQYHLDARLGFPVYDMQDVPEDFHLPADVLVRDRLSRSAAVVFREAEDAEVNVWNEVPSLLRSAIIKVHKQYSHRLRGDELIRHLRLEGASEISVEAARLFTCEVCEREARNLPRPVAAAPNYEKFGDCIAMDVAFVPCLDDKLYAFLVMVDIATHFTVAAYLVSGENPGETYKPTSDQAGQALLDWCELLGVPQKCQIDQDSCLRGIFKSALDSFGIEDILIARDPHWSHGMVDRRVLMLKEMVAKVAPEFHAKGSSLMRVVMTQCAHTINRLANNQGFSPAQRIKHHFARGDHWWKNPSCHAAQWFSHGKASSSPTTLWRELCKGESQLSPSPCTSLSSSKTAWTFRTSLHGHVQEKDGKTPDASHMAWTSPCHWQGHPWLLAASPWNANPCTCQQLEACSGIWCALSAWNLGPHQGDSWQHIWVGGWWRLHCSDDWGQGRWMANQSRTLSSFPQDQSSKPQCANTHTGWAVRSWSREVEPWQLMSCVRSVAFLANSNGMHQLLDMTCSLRLASWLANWRALQSMIWQKLQNSAGQFSKSIKVERWFSVQVSTSRMVR